MSRHFAFPQEEGEGELAVTARSGLDGTLKEETRTVAQTNPDIAVG